MSSNRQEGMIVAAPERWDEACFVVPAVRALAATGLEVGVLCPARQQPLWETLPGIRVLSLDPKPKPRATARLLREQGWNAALAWEPGPATDSFVRAAISRRLGPDDPALAKSLTDPVAAAMPPGPPPHRVALFLAVLRTMGVTIDLPEFFAPAALGLPREADTVMLAPDSDYGPSHEWPLGRWKDVAECLLARGHQVTVADLRGGRGLGEALVRELPEDTPLIAIDSPAAALPVFAVHQVVAAVDGSLPHLAAHAGARCVTLFGPNDPSWRRPLGRRHSVLVHHVECSPCLLAKCPLDHRCLLELECAPVLAAIFQQLESTAAAVERAG